MTRALDRQHDRERARRALYAIVDEFVDTTDTIPDEHTIITVGEMLSDSLTESAAVARVTHDLGPYLTSRAVERRAGNISRQAIDNRRKRWAIIGVPTDDHADQFLYPVQQFSDVGSASVLPGVREAASTLAQGINDPLTIAVWLNSPNRDLADQSAYDWLRADRAIEAVLAAARRDVHRWRQ